MKSQRFTLIDNEDFELQCEYNEKFLILHLPRLKPTPGSIKHLRMKLEELVEFADASSWQMLFTAIHPEDQKMAKLMKLIGAKLQGMAEGLNVYSLEGEI